MGSRVHVWPVAQVPMHCPPQPSATPHATPTGQRGTHTHAWVVGSQSSPAVHSRPVPHEGPPAQSLGTGAPHATSTGSVEHRGTQEHTPALHIWIAEHALPQDPQLD